MMRSNPSAPSTPPTDDLAEQLSVILADPRRRRILSTLASGTRHRSSFDDLAVAVAASERVEADDGSTSASSSEVEVTLYHTHLPKLAEAGIVRDGDLKGDVKLTETGLMCANALGVGEYGR